MTPIVNLVCLIVGSCLLGSAAGDWRVGLGVAMLAVYLFPSTRP